MGEQRRRKGYEYLEHTADAYIAAYGENLEEAFENAALATFNVMTEVEKVKPSVEESVGVEAHDEYALLYNWLEELLVRFETTGKVYSRFKVYRIEKTPLGLRLKAKIWGESFIPEKHMQKVGIKAVTYHQMEIIKKPEAVTVKFILDI
jgi:SHS2 domain-containing protein